MVVLANQRGVLGSGFVNPKSFFTWRLVEFGPKPVTDLNKDFFHRSIRAALNSTISHSIEISLTRKKINHGG